MTKPINIMLIDDHALFRSGLKMLLEQEKGALKVTAAVSSAEEAFKQLEKQEFDVILMDISLPGTDGLEATRQMKEIKPELKIIVLTMHDDEPYLLKALEAGASGYVLKEAASTELVSAVNTVMAGDITIYPKMVKTLVDEALREKREGQVGQQGKRIGDPERGTLTEREEEVLQHICRGYTNRETGEILHISVKTVEKHKEHIMQKLNLKKRHELINFAIERGLLACKKG